jgi:alkylhydroperoxidase family enzyme
MGSRGAMMARLRAAGLPIPQIQHLFAFKPDRTDHLQRFTQGVMRGPSPLSSGQRELIAAFTSRRNDCPF